MESKFYISLEAARLLKEKGYNRECIAYYQNDEFHPYSVDLFKLSISDKNAAPSYMNQYSAPTKAEAIDWLESKGIVVVVYYFKSAWQYLLYPLLNEIEDRLLKKVFIKETYPTRLEAEEAAIIKACELLKGKE